MDKRDRVLTSPNKRNFAKIRKKEANCERVKSADFIR
jgi:hypothetical protein